MREAVVVSVARTAIGRAFRGVLNNIKSSTLTAHAFGATQIMSDGMNVVVAGGAENITALNKPYGEWVAQERVPNAVAGAAASYMPMLDTAETVTDSASILRFSM